MERSLDNIRVIYHIYSEHVFCMLDICLNFMEGVKKKVPNGTLKTGYLFMERKIFKQRWQLQT